VFILRNLIKKLANFISKMNDYSEEQKELIEFALRILIFEFLKIISVIIIFSLLGYPMQVIIAIGTIVISKPYIGGYHEDNQIKCFISTLLITGSIVYLSVNIEMNYLCKIILSIITLFSIYQQAPVINPKMNITKPELIKRNMLLGIIISLILILFSLSIYKFSIVSNVITWAMLFQALLLFNKRSLLNKKERTI
jgi:Membrane protein putatively involved in post-translational modification of the autoinducing quorum-sensing peptide